ncbi:Uu.00g061400.m01.CDS01 [Anthostomella pinea]|uniref:Uu.00g061400.m01.CDS01 n=1 Tax=Anthostomella pinea TaxID=933095 RepID=A0AAI8VLW0_9PEZI|nr:Uu.00g061400.m01.CDS01 [Anthostomella pinea]
MDSSYQPGIPHPHPHSSPNSSLSSANGRSALFNANGLGSDTSSQPPHPSPVISSAGTVDSRAPPPTVPAACLGCRSKHLKCDGLNPCSRCRSSDSECVYIASRRGYKGPRRNTAHNPNKRHASDSPPSVAGDNCPMLLGAQVATPAASAMAAFHPAMVIPGTPGSAFAATPGLNTLQLYRNSFLDGASGAMVEANPQPRPQQTMPERCIDSFYYNFYPGHPSVLPKDHLLKMAKDTNLEHLLAAMRWAGSLYFDSGPSRATFFEEAMRLIYAPETPKDGFLVQAMVIVLIGLDGSCQQEKARDILSDAEQIAIELHLYSHTFATTHGNSNPRLEESWRRTWWDLFVVDGMVAGVHRQTNFLLFDLVADAGLPCEEHEYAAGNIPRPMSMEEFDDLIFSGEEREPSSFAYRVASIRNLGRMMRLPNTGFPNEENVDRIESLLSNWRMHLPKSKQHSLNKDCQLDEMMFQAHMINHACSIILHQPLSQLDSSPAREVTACAPHRAVSSGDVFNIHTKHIITAACGISKMVTYNVPITGHTHFFTCVLTLSSIVHLSKWALYFLQDEDDLRQQIRLNIGALNKLSHVWKAASRASGQVKGVAQEIYHARKAQQTNASFWVGFTQEEIIGSMSADEGIMSEINLLGGIEPPNPI